MKKRILHEKDFKKFKHFNPCAHTESVLYIDKNEVLKILDPALSDGRKETIELLCEIEHEHCVTPLYSIIIKHNDITPLSQFQITDLSPNNTYGAKTKACWFQAISTRLFFIISNI